MLLSMTGYGRGQGESGGVVLQVEARTVNHRYLDVRVHLPPAIQWLEPKIVSAVKGTLARGRVDLTVRPSRQSRALTAVRADLESARQVLSAIQALKETLHLDGEIDTMSVASFKDVLVCDDASDAAADAEQASLFAVAASLAEVVEMRRAEGQRLATDLSERLDTLEAIAGQVEGLLPGVADRARVRLETRVRELLDRRGGDRLELDESRLISEVAMLAERADVTEELVRLRSHLASMRELLTSGSAVGRQADFLCQELLREINTLGSKAAEVEVTRRVVELKSELEKVREQIQNVE